MPELLVIGEALVDVVSSPSGERAHPGGSPMNVAVGLARLGEQVTLATRIGDDEHGRMLSHHITESRVKLSPGSLSPGMRTSSATAVIKPDGSAHYDFDITWDVADLPRSGFDIMHTGSIGALLAPGGTTVAETFEAAGGGALRSFDPNIRPSVVGTLEIVLPQVDRVARASTVIKMSDEDAAWLHPNLDPGEVAARYAHLGAAIVVITRGAEGSLLRMGSDAMFIPSKSTKVVDTIGAGDSYMAGLLHFLSFVVGVDTVLGGGISPDQAADACHFAANCAAVTVSRPGADLPYLNEVDSSLLDRDEGDNR